ncbi:MAG: hypothetical protein GEU93_19740 [Propionibacteriales bacterium]|nr:hypothetical protein [Propionibacteriales bacterium]
MPWRRSRSARPTSSTPRSTASPGSAGSWEKPVSSTRRCNTGTPCWSASRPSWPRRTPSCAGNPPRLASSCGRSGRTSRLRRERDGSPAVAEPPAGACRSCARCGAGSASLADWDERVFRPGLAVVGRQVEPIHPFSGPGGHMPVVTATAESHSGPLARWRRSSYWYAGAVVVGSVLIVLTAINQPYNQNEIQQIGPYDSGSLAEITSGTRQPPLDPLLGAAVQHLLGEGQLRQRLVPIAAGIGALIVMSLLFRRLRLGAAGPFGVWVMATAPLLVRYSGYARPYALPLFLSVVFVYAGQRWMDERRIRWLVIAALAAAGLPLSRVPEPTAFLVTAGLVLAWFAVRGCFAWPAAVPLAAVAIGAVGLVGYPMYRDLASQTTGALYDPSPSRVIGGFDEGVAEIVTAQLPLLGSWLPWWPLTLAVVVVALAVPAARRRLLGWWFFWPLLAAPVAYALAYHFVNPYPFELRPYRARSAIFVIPPYILAVVALASAVTNLKAAQRWLRSAIVALLCGALLTQLTGMVRVLTTNEAPDFGQVAEILTQELPSDAIVLYDAPSEVGLWRHPFIATPRYMGHTPYTGNVSRLMKRPRKIPERGPVYVLILDGECSTSAICDAPSRPWRHVARGWHVERRFDRFTLYAPDRPADGRGGAIEAMRAFGDAMGPELGYPAYFAAAGLLTAIGRPEQGRQLVEAMYSEATPQVADDIRRIADVKGIDPFR